MYVTASGSMTSSMNYQNDGALALGRLAGVVVETLNLTGALLDVLERSRSGRQSRGRDSREGQKNDSRGSAQDGGDGELHCWNNGEGWRRLLWRKVWRVDGGL